MQPTSATLAVRVTLPVQAASDGRRRRADDIEDADLAVVGPELAAEIGRRHGSPVEMVHLNRGIFDEASISVITSLFEPATAQRGHL